MKISVQASALADLKRGYRFYEKQGEGLGTYFLDSLSADIDSLRLYAGIHGIHFDRYYRLLSSRFPFAVYYEVKDELILVRAVLDLRRDPEWTTLKIKRLR